MVLANETTSRPGIKPKIAPPAKVKTVAPGKEKAVDKM